MKEALKLAKKGISWTNPHPMVGVVIVNENKIIAEGYHHRFGDEHAESDAIKNAASQALQGSTMYVSLEPCHLPYDLHGKRIPCYEYIRRSGIKTVHIAMLDSNPEVSGRGKVLLEKAGITTTLGILNKEALELNETYHYFMTKGRPFVAITFSVSLDGKIATRTGDSKWITNEQARTYARKLRNHYQAILVGINTVLKDDPHLGTRIKGKKDPIRIILDSTLKIPLTSQVLRDTNVLIATTTKANKEKLKILTDRGIPVVVFNNNSIPLPGLLEEFKKRKIISVLVEGGGRILGSFVDAKLVDKVYAFHAPILIGGEKGVLAIQGRGYPTIKDALKLENVRIKHLGDNLLTVGVTS
ncbi:bifunctional diaminohydroxyphosphoribosylaminopyrimidine deaminase/5-amino-6-(5-phosphoribosylamino)uracil reductase RibD [Candidatus Roizmanbacteria bacterium]|nr:bifunctional diaminohydroxyphosphoribosylaminopyrimidine deaminase/5-amino-6-(5-phosphoribosylamino)uracil reductase RibD [Candidatus Roizmanbacteria bacterium]